MLPIVALLAEQGLSMLGNAILNKGKEKVEEIIGTKIPETPAGLTPEVAAKLRELEFKHEEALLAVSLEEQKLYVEDTKDARHLGIELSKSSSWLNQNIMPLLAIFTIVCSGGLLWFSNAADVKMAATSFITMVLGYFFGSSKGSKDKQELLNRVNAK